MKNLTLVLGLSVVFAFLSCSDEGKGKDSDKDLIIGKWKVEKHVEVYADGTKYIETPSDCEKKSRLTFHSDGTIDMEEFEEGIGGECVKYEDEDFISMEWEKMVDGKYKFTFTYSDSETEVEVPDQIIFPNEDTMRVQYLEDYDDVEYYYTEFSRVK